jgi:hypothetical protein
VWSTAARWNGGRRHGRKKEVLQWPPVRSRPRALRASPPSPSKPRPGGRRREKEKKEKKERKTARELTCGPKGIFDISREFSLLSNRKLLF